MPVPSSRRLIVRSCVPSYTGDFSMPRILPTLCLVIAASVVAVAQTPPASGQAPQTPPATLTLTLDDALTRARANAQQLLSADIAARITHEDRVQAKAALLPSATWQNGYIFTQPNGTDSGVFIPNNGPHEYS